MGRNKNKAPIGYTCPDINKLIDYCESMRAELKDLRTVEDPEIRDEVESICDKKIDEIIEMAEFLRKSNETLREWGEDLFDDLEEANNVIEKMDEKIYNLKEEVNSLQKELDHENSRSN